MISSEDRRGCGTGIHSHYERMAVILTLTLTGENQLQSGVKPPTLLALPPTLHHGLRKQPPGVTG